MALNKIFLEPDGLVVGATQLVASGGGVSIGQNLVVQGSGYLGNVAVTGTSTLSNVTIQGTGTFVGTANTASTVITNTIEPVTLNTISTPAAVTFYTASQSILFFQANATTNFTINFSHSPTTTLNSLLSVGQSILAVLFTTQGSSAYYNTGVTVDGSSTNVTTRWSGGTAPSSGNASGIDVYSYSIIKTANATYTVLASQSQYK